MDFAIFYEIDKLRQKKHTKIKKRVNFSKYFGIFRKFLNISLSLRGQGNERSEWVWPEEHQAPNVNSE